MFFMSWIKVFLLGRGDSLEGFPGGLPSVDALNENQKQFLLVVLNVVLTMGVWKFTDIQDQFGRRLLAIERWCGIPVVRFKTEGLFRARHFYLLVMVGISVVSLALFLIEW